jgi:addiction module RelB/DinJ family antitoxin
MEAQSDIRVTIRVNKELKESAEALFNYLGLNMSNAINMFLRKSVDENGIPFPVGKGNVADSDAPEYDFSPDAVTKVFAESVSRDVYDKLRSGVPVARYDASKKQAYLLHPDGTREYI